MSAATAPGSPGSQSTSVPVWFAALTGIGTSSLLVTVYICCDISVYLTGERASQGFTQQTLLLTTSVISIVIGSVLSYLERGRRGLAECFDPRAVRRLLPVSICFVLSMLGLLTAFPHFDGAFLKLMGQMKLPLTAFLSAAVLGRRYSLVQWLIILLIFSSCTSFTVLKLGHVAVGAVPIVGLVAVFGWVTFNVLATLSAERAFKEQRQLPFATVTCNMRIGELLAAVFLLSIRPDFHVRDFFRGWDLSTLALLATFVGDSWLSGLMVSRLSSVTTKVAKCISLVVLYCIALLSRKTDFVLVQALGALMIVQATALFALVTWEQSQRQKLSSPAATAALQGETPPRLSGPGQSPAA